VQIRNAAGVNLVGQGIDTTTLSFTGVSAQTNGIDVIGDDFLVQDLTVLDAGKDGIRVEASDGVTFRRIRATWTNRAARPTAPTASTRSAARTSWWRTASPRTRRTPASTWASAAT
jgi:hypothetical protein